MQGLQEFVKESQPSYFCGRREAFVLCSFIAQQRSTFAQSSHGGWHSTINSSIMENIQEADFETRKAAVLEAIRKGEYEVQIEEPNNIMRRTHPDGTDFYYLRGDDIKFGVSAGSCTVTVEGIEFTCELDWGEWSGDDDEFLADEEVMDAIEGIDGVICGEHHSDDEYIAIYEAANNCTVEEYYGCWEDDIPMDADDMESLDDMCHVTAIEYEGEKYYIIHDQMHEADDEHGGRRWAYAATGGPDNWGRFACAVVVLDGEKKEDIGKEIIVEVMDSDVMMDQYGDIE